MQDVKEISIARERFAGFVIYSVIALATLQVYNVYKFNTQHVILRVEYDPVEDKNTAEAPPEPTAMNPARWPKRLTP